ncbi:hypothetical protein HU200_040190 [Digitaria exilis]|uniref:C2H2-type domain-containing protein n=1 Tax=Digitaria exilis TaxID=1010633 RepID=A0A835EEX3_9POAL|nr:hypothetical protein HU200_040190 [Digitaria exilis]
MRPTSSSTSAGGDGELHNPPLVKRKRTKRPRHHHQHQPASSSESTTTEEEDMAHCLILLAAGGAADVDSKPPPSSPAAPPPTTAAAMKSGERYTSRKYTEAVATADGVKAGFYVYECKTCNKCFPTFQALGGHRASHKKPRLSSAAAGVEDAINNNLKASPTTMMMSPPPPLLQMADVVTTALSLNSCGAIISSKQLRVHECSICGAEFASGQALGGHMRRHRPLNAPPPPPVNKQLQVVELDLNLPAPEEVSSAVVLGLGQFTDPGNKSAGGLVLTASPLVDCHY